MTDPPATGQLTHITHPQAGCQGELRQAKFGLTTDRCPLRIVFRLFVGNQPHRPSRNSGEYRFYLLITQFLDKYRVSGNPGVIQTSPDCGHAGD